MNGKWLNREIDVVFPVEVSRECINNIAIRDASGDIVCEFTCNRGHVSETDLLRMRWVVQAMNGIAGLATGRVVDFKRAGKSCESEWEQIP